MAAVNVTLTETHRRNTNFILKVLVSHIHPSSNQYLRSVQSPLLLSSLHVLTFLSLPFIAGNHANFALISTTYTGERHQHLYPSGETYDQVPSYYASVSTQQAVLNGKQRISA
ncbi:uncharacterized protein Bfra_011858 [Botrytis fragariae]|uniref:Uncharacterized protein n=1 Tax=Botrytis fragariae TaxID=1964551 RepID=A0A8H6EE89_9HELO|nr:uncharacterized protein Bfra_011858 [Botrytis fragariae]KAF5868893.1 hypothetical protein Bfra_011858 [Botrytis fragariae]